MSPLLCTEGRRNDKYVTVCQILFAFLNNIFDQTIFNLQQFSRSVSLNHIYTCRQILTWCVGPRNGGGGKSGFFWFKIPGGINVPPGTMNLVSMYLPAR